MIRPREKFRNQVKYAKQRGIEFHFTFEEWWDWWQIDNRWESRGNKSGQLVMARNGDVGPYAHWNVHCATTEQNAFETRGEKRKASSLARWERDRAAGIKSVFAKRGFGHPQSIPVETPAGIFGSAELAGEHHGMSGASIRYRVKKCFPGFRELAPGRAFTCKPIVAAIAERAR